MKVEKALVESIIQDIIGYLHEEKSIAIDEAMKVIYNSKIYEKLIDIETGLYREILLEIVTFP